MASLCGLGTSFGGHWWSVCFSLSWFYRNSLLVHHLQGLWNHVPRVHHAALHAQQQATGMIFKVPPPTSTSRVCSVFLSTHPPLIMSHPCASPAAEEAAHWERHCHHCVPRTRGTPLHPQKHPLPLPARLCRCARSQPMLREQLLQVSS